MAGKEEEFKYCLYFAANNLARRVNEMADEAFSVTGLSPSLAFLLMLVNDVPGTTPTELADKLALSSSTITRFADKLENKGFIRRQADGKNMRIYPTEKGKNHNEILEKAWDSLYADFANIIDKKDYELVTGSIYHVFLALKKK